MLIILTLSREFKLFSDQFVRHSLDEHHNAIQTWPAGVMCGASRVAYVQARKDRAGEQRHVRTFARAASFRGDDARLRACASPIRVPPTAAEVGFSTTWARLRCSSSDERPRQLWVRQGGPFPCCLPKAWRGFRQDEQLVRPSRGKTVVAVWVVVSFSC
jgi:hypothetical protein